MKVMECKEYKYIPELLQMIVKFWEESGCTTRKRNALPSNRPSHIQCTIAHTDPPNTHTIVENKKSRFA